MRGWKGTEPWRPLARKIEELHRQYREKLVIFRSLGPAEGTRTQESTTPDNLASRSKLLMKELMITTVEPPEATKG